jgi:hypothetical protein
MFPDSSRKFCGVNFTRLTPALPQSNPAPPRESDILSD